MLAGVLVQAAFVLSGVCRASTIDRIDDVVGWTVNADGSRDISFRTDGGDYHSPPVSMRVVYTGHRWGNLRHAVRVPPEATAVTFWVRIHKASPGAAVHVWLNEPDGDGHVARVRIDGDDPPDWPRTWTHVSVPLGRFQYDPRGNQVPDLLSVDHMLLGFNFAPMEVGVDDIAWELRDGVGRSPMPRSEPFRVESGPLGKIAILDEPGLASGAGASPRAHAPPDSGPVANETVRWLATVLRGGGFGVTRLRAGDLADAERLTRSNFDLLILPQGDRFPVEAKQSVQTFLQTGGALWTSGGYAFDRPVAWTPEGWRDVGTFETAAEIKAGRGPDPRINTRFGRPGDAMTFDKMQIGMFDPSYAFERVARAEIAGRYLSGSINGLAACITDPTGSPVFGKANLRFIPLGRTYDRLGRPRGPLGGLAHHFAGPYAGSSWAFFGVDNRDLFAADGIPAEFVTSLARRLVDQVYLHSLTTDLACYRDGEPVHIGVRVANRGRSTQTAELQIVVEDRVVHTGPLEIAPDNGSSRSIEVTWHPGRFDRDFYHVRAVLRLPYHTDVVENAFCVWNETVIRSGPRLSLRDNYFRIGKRPTFLTGTNQTGRMWLSEYENPLVWRDDFAGMRDHGLTLWRVLHFSAVMHRNDPLSLAGEIPRNILRQTDAIVQLAQTYGVVIFLTLHDWMPVELTDEQLAAQARWNAFWADRYKDVPGILYDIQNEPSMWVPDAPHVTAEWKRFVTERHGGIEVAARAWGLAADDTALLKPRAAGTSWADLKAVDAERFRVHLLNRWIKANADAVHRVDPDALVTVGFLQGMRPADKVLGADHLDFANMHSYVPLRKFAADFKILDRRAIGKTLTLGEFGAREAHDARVHGADGDRPAESIQRYLMTNHYVLGLGGSFTSSWCWRDMPDCVFPWGMVRSDHMPKPVLHAYRNFTLMTRFIQPRYEPPQVHLVLPDAHRLGGQWNRLQEALDRTIDVLLGLRVGFGVLREKDIATVTPSTSTPAAGSDGSAQEAPALIWPIPYCPDEATFAAVKRVVQAGGSLYLSGDVSFDEHRRPTQSSRLTELGLKCDRHPPPFENVEPGPVQKVLLGKGRVFFVPYPVELTDRRNIHARLSEFLDDAGVRRLPVEPDHPDLHVSATPTVDDGIVYSLLNHGEPRTAKLSVGTEAMSLHLAKIGYGLAGLDRQGRLTMIQAQGPVWRGAHPVLETDADVMVVALDGRDLADAARMLLMPNAAGRVELVSRRVWTRPVAVIGQIDGGRFITLETVPLRPNGGKLTVQVDADRALTLIVLAEEPDVAPATDAVTVALMLDSG